MFLLAESPLVCVVNVVSHLAMTLLAVTNSGEKPGRLRESSTEKQ